MKRIPASSGWLAPVRPRCRVSASIRGVPLGELCIPHREPVMVCSRPACKSGARLLEQCRPFVRIELFAGKQRNEVFVARIWSWAVGLHMVLVLRGSLAVHVVGVRRSCRTGPSRRPNAYRCRTWRPLAIAASRAPGASASLVGRIVASSILLALLIGFLG